jgi:hypothetical protein
MVLDDGFGASLVAGKWRSGVLFRRRASEGRCRRVADDAAAASFVKAARTALSDSAVRR